MRTLPVGLNTYQVGASTRSVRTNSVFMMICTFYGAGEARNNICEKCAAEKDIDDVIKHFSHRRYSYDAIVEKASICVCEHLRDV